MNLGQLDPLWQTWQLGWYPAFSRKLGNRGAIISDDCISRNGVQVPEKGIPELSELHIKCEMKIGDGRERDSLGLNKKGFLEHLLL